MDQIDKTLIRLLHENARIPLKRLAEEVYLSPPAVAARIERLQENQVIQGYYAKINMQRLGYHVLAFVNLAMAPDQRERFLTFAHHCPNILECCHMAGNYSMLMKVCFENTDQLEHFVAQVQKFGATQTQVVLSTIIEPREMTGSEKEQVD